MRVTISRTQQATDCLLPNAQFTIHRPRIRFWLWPNVLSLDAPIIAVLWCSLFAGSAGVWVSDVTIAVAALTVWIIYIADRLLDSLQPQSAGLPARHQFCREHRTTLAALCAALLLIASWLVFTRLDPETLRCGLLFMGVIGLYFAVVHMLRSTPSKMAKEAAVAALFGLGAYLPVWAHDPRFTPAAAVSVGLFILICWLNTVLIEYAEWSTAPDASSVPHASTVLAGKHLSRIGLALAIAGMALMYSGAFASARPVLTAEVLSAIGLAALARYWQHLSPDSVRVVADVTLLSPAVVLLFGHL